MNPTTKQETVEATASTGPTAAMLGRQWACRQHVGLWAVVPWSLSDGYVHGKTGLSKVMQPYEIANSQMGQDKWG